MTLKLITTTRDVIRRQLLRDMRRTATALESAMREDHPVERVLMLEFVEKQLLRDAVSLERLGYPRLAAWVRAACVHSDQGPRGGGGPPRCALAMPIPRNLSPITAVAQVTPRSVR